MSGTEDVEIRRDDALIIVDVQNDFLPGGALAVNDGDAVIPAINKYLRVFTTNELPIFATRDWHPAGHCSFVDNGRPWPNHCVANSLGAQFAEELALPDDVTIVHKGTDVDKDAYSGFQDTDLADQLHAHGVKRVFVGGLATDYCVLSTVSDALAEGFDVVLLMCAIRAVNDNPGDGDRAIESMLGQGAIKHYGSVLAD